MLVRAPSRLGHGVKQAFPQLTVTSSKGLSVNTECGRTLMDFSSGIGVCNLGHSHEGVVKAVVKAAQTLCHAQITITKHKPMMQVIDKLANLPNSVKNSLDSWLSGRDLTYLPRQLCGSQGGTYSANAVACAASLAVFDAFEDGSLLRNVKAREKQVREILTKFNRAHPGVIREVRGAGLMIGIELFNNSTGSFGSLAHKVVNECQKRDLIVLSCGPFDTLRLIPPLTITEAEAAKGMNILCEAIVAAAKGEGKGDREVVPVMATFKPHVKSASTTA